MRSETWRKAARLLALLAVAGFQAPADREEQPGLPNTALAEQRLAV